jgi:hypothetical protein
MAEPKGADASELLLRLVTMFYSVEYSLAMFMESVRDNVPDRDMPFFWQNMFMPEISRLHFTTVNFIAREGRSGTD